jgi:hypothetical protein
MIAAIDRPPAKATPPDQARRTSFVGGQGGPHPARHREKGLDDISRDPDSPGDRVVGLTGQEEAFESATTRRPGAARRPTADQHHPIMTRYDRSDREERSVTGSCGSRRRTALAHTRMAPYAVH